MVIHKAPPTSDNSAPTATAADTQRRCRQAALPPASSSPPLVDRALLSIWKDHVPESETCDNAVSSNVYEAVNAEFH